MKLNKREIKLYIFPVLAGIITVVLTVEGVAYYFPEIDKRLVFIFLMSVISIVEMLMFVYSKPLQNPKFSLGSEGMVNKKGIVVENCFPNGRVRLANELWNARAINNEPITKGEEVIVKSVEGLNLIVQKISTQSPA